MASPAERYLATFSPEDQELIRSSSGGNLNAWYQNAVAAGAVPQEFVTPQGGAEGEPTGTQGGTGGPRDPKLDEILGREWAGNDPWKIFQDTTPEMLKQMTPEERAKWSRTHINGDYDEATWVAAQEHYDPKCPVRMPYRSKKGAGQAGVPKAGDADTSNCTEFPENSWQDKNGGQWGGWEGGNDGESYIPPDRMAELKASGQANPGGPNNKPGNQPPPPQTFGNQLSMTGNVMQDMLLQQFNTGQQNTYAQGANIFGLGEDFRAGGEGTNADKQANIQGQSLAGGGIWWGQGQETFKGQDQKDVFRADTKNLAKGDTGGETGTGACPPGQEMTQTGCKPKAQVDPAPAQPAQGGGNRANNQNQGVSVMLSNQTFAPVDEAPKTTPVTSMINNQYNRRRTAGQGQPPRFF